METIKQLWRRIRDDSAIWAATLAGVVGSMLWPHALNMLLHGVLPAFSRVDLVRLFGAAIVAIALAVKADTEGTPEQRHTPTAIKRRVKAAFARGFSWQTAIAAITAMMQGGG